MAISSAFRPKYLILHDYGQPPKDDRDILPSYHATVLPSGDVRYRYPEAPYTTGKAPHAFQLNNKALGLSYLGNVGGQPTPTGMRALQDEYERIQSIYPGVETMTHGQAFKRAIDVGDIPSPSAEGRGLTEASGWADQVAARSRVPASGELPKLSLLSTKNESNEDVGRLPAISAIPASGLAAARMSLGGPKDVPITDAMEPSFTDRLMNPALLMGLSVLGAPAGNWGQGIGQGVQAAGVYAKGQREQAEFQRLRAQQATRDRVWAEAFPGGQPNPSHPLTKGIPADLLATTYAMGPEHGLDQLGKLALMSAESKQKLAMQQQMGELMAKQILGTEAPGAAPAGQAAPAFTGGTVAAPAASPASAPGTAVEGPGARTVSYPVPSFQTPAAAPGGPALAYPAGSRSIGAGEAVLNDPNLKRIMYGHIMAGKPDEAMKAYQSALEKAQAPRLAGETKYSQDIAEQQASDVAIQKTYREAWGLIDQLERQAKSLGNARLSAAASPTLDTWTGQNVQRHFQPQAYADRQLLMPYLEQLTVLARSQMKGQGSLSDQEQGMLQRALASARNATDDKTFFQHLDVARSILSNKLPERAGYVPAATSAREEEQAAATKALRYASKTAPAASNAPSRATVDMVPPAQAAARVDRLDSAELEGKAVYDSKTGRWGRVVNGEFMGMKDLLKGRGTRAPWMH